jgi:hypothetical protein
MSLYRRLLAQAWKNTWENKYLWFLGLFAALVGSASELNLLFQSFGDVVDRGLFPGLRSFLATGIFSRQAALNFGDLMINDSFGLLMSLTVMAVLLMLLCFLVWFSVVSQAGLVNNYSRIVAKKSHNLGEGLDTGIKKFWPVFGLYVLLKIVIYLIFTVIALPIVLWFVQPSVAQNFVFFVAYVIFIPASIIIAFVVKYAVGYVVIKGEKFVDACSLGWELFLKNWLVSLEMAFILFGISFVATLILLLCLAALAIPFLFLSFLIPQLAGIINMGLLLFCFLILFILIVVGFGSILSTFQVTAWTGLFIELINKSGVSKIVRIFGKD